MLLYIHTYIMMALLSFTLTEPASYKLDTGHTMISFNVERFMVGEVTGIFKEFDGSVKYDQDNIENFSADVTIKVHSLDSNNDTRDGHLKGKGWLDADAFPTISFKSSRAWEENGENYVEGELNIHGVTNTVQFPFTVKGPFQDPTGAMTIGLQGDLVINRLDYGIKFNRFMDNGEVFIGNDVRISIRALAAISE